MAFRSEAEEWAQERRKVAARQSARGRALARWFGGPSEPEPDHFVWRDIADFIPIQPEQET